MESDTKGMSEQVNEIEKGVTQEQGERIDGIGERNERIENEIDEQRNEMEMKLETEFELKREEMALKIAEGKTQAVRMGEKLKEEIGSTKQRVDEVNKGLEGYCACVATIVQRQEEELEFCKRRGGG